MSIDSQELIAARLAEIAAEAMKINPRTAGMVWWYVQTEDPYDLGVEIPPEYDQTGREYFLIDPEGTGPAVLVGTVRDLHPEIDDEEWKTLMAAAAARDESPDPLSIFHAYR